MEYLTPDEAAERLKITRRTLYQWLRSGKVEATKLNNMWRIPEKEIDRLLGGEQEGKE